MIAVLERKPMGELFQLGTGTETSVTELVDQLSRSSRTVRSTVRHEPARAGEIARSFSDISRAREALGYDPSVGPRRGARGDTRDWFVNAPRA